MYQGPNFFHSIRIQPPEKEIYARLGFRKGITELNPAERDAINRTIEDAAGLVSIKGAARVMGLRSVGENGVTLEDETVLPSRALAVMLAGSSGVLLMGATAGPDVMEAIASCSMGDLTRAVILDAVASEMTDAALSWIMDYVGQDLLRSARRLTRKRFSAGYGDFSLENQWDIYTLLSLGSIGITMTPTCVLIPEKSVTAVAGVLSLT
ncbi:MAG TPA: hypothetical protein PLT09_04660 [Deltaproteobacteria bacterium]|nr:hypothetical protein [Deltaproteobacteria bacterium]HPR53907.1 hypothetical protein [Deltaproteobacteria bacterium]HXK46707.1 hypothetical protein [Deltaproteobacteria bacterium]